MNAQSKFEKLLVACALLLSLACSKSADSVDGDEEETDTTAPAAVSDLAIISFTTTSATLQWTAPGDDDTTGVAVEYDLRASYDSITAQNFAQAFQLDDCPPPLPAGMSHQYSLDGLQADSTYYFAIKTLDDAGHWSAISNCPNVHCPAIQVVVFADTALERVMREHIGKPTGDILSSDVDTVTQIIAEELGITSLSGLEYCVSLENILMADNEISDITPLAGLTQLWGVHISWNDVSDISPLQGHTALTQLHLSQNPVTDLGPVASMTSLEQLVMGETHITDYSPLYGLPHFSDIYLGSCNLSDISFMSNLTHLRIAQLPFNQITSIEPLRNLTTLQGLGLIYNQITNIEPLANLVNLVDLNLFGNQISDIQPLIDNTGLGSGDVVSIQSNPLSQHTIDVLIPALEARGVTVYH
jgi:hypothetical protein